jgi:uncharacterized membrane protein
MKNYRTGLLLFVVVLIVGFNAGYNIMQAVFFGGLSLIGLIVMVESIPPLKWLLSRSSQFFDILIFVFTIMATISYGLTIAASLTVTGLGYSLFYGPYLREQRLGKAPKKKQPLNNHSNNYDWK